VVDSSLDMSTAQSEMPAISYNNNNNDNLCYENLGN
jgi:hypothetical protein